MDYPHSVSGAGLVGGEFVNEDPMLGRQGSMIPAQWGNAVTKELLNVIEAAGLTPDEGRLDQLLTAVGKLQSELAFDSGMVVFDAAGAHTWPVPNVLKSGKKKARVRGVGGGGAGFVGGGAPNGGGGGGYFEVLVDLTGVATVPVTVGAGGQQGVAHGGASSFGAYASATGGSNSSGSPSGADGFGGSGSSSVAGAIIIEGARGGHSLRTADGTGISGGNGGNSAISGIGIGSTTGSVMCWPGGGSGGTGASGRPGAAGAVFIEW